MTLLLNIGTIQTYSVKRSKIKESKDLQDVARSSKDLSHQELAQLKNNSFVYVVYDGVKNCYPYCSLTVSGHKTYFKDKAKLVRASKDIAKNKLICAMPVYLILNGAKTKQSLNCTTVINPSELVLPQQLVIFNRDSDSKGKISNPNEKYLRIYIYI